ncbi:MAG TPA: transketolase [Thermoleophilaceae bacterium]|nr:transketolase [Thermoleophilaceae bacterium]
MSTEAREARETSGGTDLERHAIDAIRTLVLDAVERAGSGHPGMPLAMAPVAYLLYARHLRHNPSDPEWPDRDRFVLSAGHGSMLLYSALHLAGYDLPLSEIERFRQWESMTPGHPERDRTHVTPGVETTTGPLGQGFANGVGMALAERFLRERYGDEVTDHRVFVICSDGDLMEGVGSEAASLAGHLGLGRLVYVYDDNHITIDGSTDLAFSSEDVDARFRAYGWHVQACDDVNDLETVGAAIEAACAEEERPSLIRVRTIIGWPAPNKQNTAAAHGQALGEDEVRATKEILGLDPDAHFEVPDEAYAAFRPNAERGAELQRDWEGRFERWRSERPELAEEWDRAWSGRPEPGIAEALPSFPADPDEEIATRSAGNKVMQAFGPLVPTMVGGAADLVESTKTEFEGEADYTREHAGRNVHFGVREHGMGSAVNGMALHGGIVKPYGSTFLIFSDYMRPAIRLSALMRLPVVWVFTHDSVGLGEDGPTHQPIEHYAALRAIPGLVVIRPADATETAEAWRATLEEIDEPVCLLLTRHKVPVLDRSELAGAEGTRRGAYVLAGPGAAGSDADADVAIVATGSEVEVALAARERLAERGVAARVISMPSWELFEAQDQDYRREVLPPELPTVSVEAGVEQGWSRFVDRSVSIERFGASAPGTEALRRLGITSDAVVAEVLELLERRPPPA